MMIVSKAFFIGLTAGALVGASATAWVIKSYQARVELRELKTEARSVAKVQTRMNAAATHYERERAQIEKQSEAPAHDLETYLDQHPAVHDLDLGTEWLCIADRAAGLADARCAAEPVAAVPGAGAAGVELGTGHLAGVPPRAAPAPHLPSTARRAGGSGSEAPSSRRGTSATPPKSHH